MKLSAGRGVSKIEEGRNPQGCVEVTVEYCSHPGSLENHICILKSQKYHGEQLLNPVPVPAGQVTSHGGEAGQALLGMCDPYREAQRSVCSVLSLLWKSLRRVTGLCLGGVRTNGQNLAKADHLNNALCTFLFSSVETR